MSGWFPSLGLEAVVVAAGLLGFGYLLADLAVGARQVDVLVRWALALPALVGWAFLLMLLHMATRGHVFSNPWLVRGLTGAAAAALAGLKLVGRRRAPAAGRAELLAAAGITMAALVVFGLPLVRMVPIGAPGTDTGWHMGWANQLLRGESTPSALITGKVPNYYPWMFHALVALIARFTPGGSPFRALGPLQLAQVSGVTVGLFVLGRHVAGSWLSGAATALFGALAAGLAFALIPAVDTTFHTPQGAGSRGTYNVSFNNLAPPLPRDLGYTLFIVFLLLLLLGLRPRSRGLLLGAGFVLGLAGISSAEFFFVGLVVATAMGLARPGVSRLATGGALLGPAIGVYAVWMVPLLVSYARLGGFVNTTVIGEVALGPLSILLSWGLATPFGAYGLIRALPAAGRDPGPRLLLATLAAAVLVLLLSSLVPRVLGSGFQIVGRASRYWPILYLAVALLAGLGAGAVLEAVRARPWVAAGVAGGIAALAIPLPLHSSATLQDVMHRAPVLADAVLGRRNVFSVLEDAGSGRCVMAVPPTIGFYAFAFTGYRQLAFVGDGAHPGNEARVRWRNIYRRIPTEQSRFADEHALTNFDTPSREWRAIAARYGVDLLVVRGRRAATEGFRGLPRLGADATGGGLSVFRVAPCPGG